MQCVASKSVSSVPDEQSNADHVVGDEMLRFVEPATNTFQRLTISRDGCVGRAPP